MVAELEAQCTEIAAVAAHNEEAAKAASAAANEAMRARQATDARLVRSLTCGFEKH